MRFTWIINEVGQRLTSFFFATSNDINLKQINEVYALEAIEVKAQLTLVKAGNSRWASGNVPVLTNFSCSAVAWHGNNCASIAINTPSQRTFSSDKQVQVSPVTRPENGEK